MCSYFKPEVVLVLLRGSTCALQNPLAATLSSDQAQKYEGTLCDLNKVANPQTLLFFFQ